MSTLFDNIKVLNALTSPSVMAERAFIFWIYELYFAQQQHNTIYGHNRETYSIIISLIIIIILSGLTKVPIALICVRSSCMFEHNTYITVFAWKQCIFIHDIIYIKLRIACSCHHPTNLNARWDVHHLFFLCVCYRYHNFDNYHIVFIECENCSSCAMQCIEYVSFDQMEIKLLCVNRKKHLKIFERKL